MNAPDERPTIGERYGLATRATRLTVDARVRGPADMLIAAGWLGNSLGALLLRLRDEYDTVRADHLLALKHWRHARQAIHAELSDTFVGPPRKERWQDFQDLCIDGPRAAFTAQALILIRLKTLKSTKEALGRYVLIQANRHRFMRPDHEVAALAGLVLDAFLDPTCHHCTGLGFTGGYGGPTTPCRPCHQTGERRENIGKDEQSRQFAKFLLVRLDNLVDVAQGRMGKSTRNHQPPEGQTDDH
jgi:hypothetical protein